MSFTALAPTPGYAGLLSIYSTQQYIIVVLSSRLIVNLSCSDYKATESLFKYVF
jgi:hypothetical protein